MDYEQKYKEALERMKSWARGEHPECFTKAQKAAEFIFPELAESEKEKNIKDLIDELKCSLRAANCQNDDCGGGHEKRIALLEWGIAWLEKQGNNNSISPEEMNKSISRRIALSLINYLDDNRYEGAMNMSSIECKDLENSILDSDWSKVYRYMRKKLEKQGEQNPVWNKEDITNYSKVLFCLQTLTFPIDSERKELITWLKKQCEQSSADVECKAKREAEQNLAWSKEDENIIDDLTQTISQYTVFAHREPKEIIQWLKSLKPQSRWKPTQEQMRALSMVYKDSLTSGENLITQTETLKSLYNDLKKL